ncbi:MAG: Zn-dependent hydrolase [Flavobacteriaceae bacterium]|nr:Zn-dependent hydrolase [Flavobacteriaceae bacterium]
MDIQLIRNATVKINYGGKTFLVDPFFADPYSLPAFAGKSANPLVPLPFPISDILQGADYILITHLHPDHFDEKAQVNISKSKPFLVQPSDSEPLKQMEFHNLTVIENEIQIDSIKINRVNAQHGEGKILKAMGAVSGYVLSAPEEKTLYLTGDTIWCEYVKSTLDTHRPEVVICNAGGNIFYADNHPFKQHLALSRDYTVVMDKKQVLEMMNYMDSMKVIVTHIGALDHETVTREQMKVYLKSKSVNMDRVFVPEDGEKIQL